MLVYDEICIKAKVRECNGVIKTNFLGGEVSKEGVNWACIVYVTIDSVMKMGKKWTIRKFLYKSAKTE